MSKRASRFTKTVRAKREALDRGRRGESGGCCSDTDCRCKVKPRKAQTEGGCE